MGLCPTNVENKLRFVPLVYLSRFVGQRIAQIMVRGPSMPCPLTELFDSHQFRCRNMDNVQTPRTVDRGMFFAEARGQAKESLARFSGRSNQASASPRGISRPTPSLSI